MRRHDREQSREFALQAVDECGYAALGTVNADGTPYCVPLTIVREGENIYFHCALAGQKLDNLRRQPRVSLCCVSRARAVQETLSIDYASAVVEGLAEEVTDPEEKAHALRILCARYAPENGEGAENCIRRDTQKTGIVRIRILSITGKANR